MHGVSCNGVCIGTDREENSVLKRRGTGKGSPSPSGGNGKLREVETIFYTDKTIRVPRKNYSIVVRVVRKDSVGEVGLVEGI